MGLSLIEELYGPEDCNTIRSFYKEDVSLHDALRQAIGDKIILSSDKFLSTKPVDIIFLICLRSKFASSEDECQRVALTIFQVLHETNPLPYIMDDQGLPLANKTLISLSFFKRALEHRWRYHGAPSPSFYRNVSKTIFNNNNQKDIAAHHEKWEGFLGEMFC